jgi:probable HAF family extracellular repeat protein
MTVDCNWTKERDDDMSTIRLRTSKLRAALAIPLVAALGMTASAHAEQRRAERRDGTTEYVITELGSLGGTSSAGSSINDRGWVAGASNLDGDEVSHATLWRNGAPTDLGTLGGPNSAVLWPVKNNRGLIVGVAETADLDPRGELWSCSFFFPSGSTGHVCRGFVWRGGEMTALPTLGGTHGFAAGANDRGQVVGWAEIAAEDPTCNAPQELGFRAALWDVRNDRTRELPPLPGDSASSATAINARGQVVGISGICANAVGGFSARHAVLWNKGQPTDIGNFGGVAWNTPMAINDRGVVVGFANAAGAAGDAFDERAFIWTKQGGFQALDALADNTRSQALGVNNRGQVVGLSRGPAGTRAVIWNAGGATDLNTLVPGYDGHLVFANDLNDSGVITGAAISAESGEVVAFRATPTDRGQD